MVTLTLSTVARFRNFARFRMGEGSEKVNYSKKVLED
jgi:hypothetical protein